MRSRVPRKDNGQGILRGSSAQIRRTDSSNTYCNGALGKERSTRLRWQCVGKPAVTSKIQEKAVDGRQVQLSPALCFAG